MCHTTLGPAGDACEMLVASACPLRRGSFCVVDATRGWGPTRACACVRGCVGVRLNPKRVCVSPIHRKIKNKTCALRWARTWSTRWCCGAPPRATAGKTLGRSRHRRGAAKRSLRRAGRWRPSSRTPRGTTGRPTLRRFWTRAPGGPEACTTNARCATAARS